MVLVLKASIWKGSPKLGKDFPQAHKKLSYRKQAHDRKKGPHKCLGPWHYGTSLACQINLGRSSPTPTAHRTSAVVVCWVTLTPAGTTADSSLSELSGEWDKNELGLIKSQFLASYTVVTLPKVGGKRTSQPRRLQAWYHSHLCLTLHKDSLDFLIAASESCKKAKRWDNLKTKQ